ncbi:MAG: ADP-ribosylation factor-like protein [Promethearchaeota archaeon]
MEIVNLIESSVIKALVFSAYDKFGPQPIYMFPKEVSTKEQEELKKQNIFKLTLRDYILISVKNLSLLIGDRDFPNFQDNLQDLPYIGILPYPDFNLTSLTFYHMIKPNFSNKPVASAFSILVDENRRSFLYNNINKFKPLIIGFFNKFEKEISNDFKASKEIEPLFRDLLLKIIRLEKKPFASITSQRKMKILFAGLDDSGKTSFLLSIDQKYSKLIGLKPTVGVDVKSIEALGTNIFLWDLGGQSKSRQKYLEKSQIYLYETDLLFYFIDIKNSNRFEESFEYLQKIKINLEKFNQNTPIIYVLSKGDKDILDSKEIKENIKFVRSKLANIDSKDDLDIHITSIFSIFSILRAFSSGISKLSPNRELINYNLKNFSNRTGVYLSLLLNNEGLVLADYYSEKTVNLIKSPISEELTDKENLRNIFEVAAPQFTMLFKIFSKFKALQEDEAIFEIANSVVLLKKVQIADYIMFILFLMKEENKKKRINELLPDFLYRTSDLLLRYIS